MDIEPPFRCDFGFNISIGDSFSAGPKLVILDASTVEIGNDVSRDCRAFVLTLLFLKVHFGHDVHLYAVDHP